MLNGPATPVRRILLRLAMHFVTQPVPPAILLVMCPLCPARR